MGIGGLIDDLVETPHAPNFGQSTGPIPWGEPGIVARAEMVRPDAGDEHDESKRKPRGGQQPIESDEPQQPSLQELPRRGSAAAGLAGSAVAGSCAAADRDAARPARRRRADERLTDLGAGSAHGGSGPLRKMR